MLADKLFLLQATLEAYNSVVIAYSGGVDSVFLAHVAHGVLGQRAVAVIADSPSLPRRELAEALTIAQQFNFPVHVINTREFQDPNYTSNPLNRCYYCKHELFSELVPIAKEMGASAIVYGENASDAGDFRPGSAAAKEFNIRAPLKEVGLTKEEIRLLSARFGLPTADKPQMACLSSRVPHGEPVTAQKLWMIESAENTLRDLGFIDIRVRHHELPGTMLTPAAPAPLPNLAAPRSSSALARIEVGTSELPRLLDPNLSSRITEALKHIGYQHVTLDLQGYRRGGANLSAAPIEH